MCEPTFKAQHRRDPEQLIIEIENLISRIRLLRIDIASYLIINAQKFDDKVFSKDYESFGDS
jgi:hypothetical protein